jgi:hypothetical protein
LDAGERREHGDLEEQLAKLRYRTAPSAIRSRAESIARVTGRMRLAHPHQHLIFSQQRCVACQNTTRFRLPRRSNCNPTGPTNTLTHDTRIRARSHTSHSAISIQTPLWIGSSADSAGGPVLAGIGCTQVQNASADPTSERTSELRPNGRLFELRRR